MQISSSQSDRSFVQSFDIVCCTDLDALFNTRHIVHDCKAQTAAAHFVSLVFSVCMSRVDSLDVRSVKCGVKHTLERILSLHIVVTHPYLLLTCST